MLWDLKDARRFGVTPQHKGPVWSLAYSKGDGSVLASGTPCCHACWPVSVKRAILALQLSLCCSWHRVCASNCSMCNASLLVSSHWASCPFLQVLAAV